jgi:hypothetical protein
MAMSDDVLTYRWWVSRIGCWLRFSSRPHRVFHGDSRVQPRPGGLYDEGDFTQTPVYGENTG